MILPGASRERGRKWAREGREENGWESESLPPQTKIYDYIVDAYVVVVVVVGGSTQLVDELYDAVQQNVDDGRL